MTPPLPRDLAVVQVVMSGFRGLCLVHECKIGASGEVRG
jgi:hypothetical protein